MFALILNSEDLRGGAARAANRLHEALRSIDVDARMLVQVKHGDAQSVIGPKTGWARLVGQVRPAADLAPLLFYRHRRKATFYPGWLPDSVSSRVRALGPDIVHLHWITGGFLKVSNLRGLGLPLVWTLHDMWAFTGGCHYDEGCGKYASGCRACPMLGSHQKYDLSYWGWRRKAVAYKALGLHIVAPSRWLADAARNSLLLGNFPVTVIPNAINTKRFCPIDKMHARRLLGLPQNRRLILFGALFATSETRKGYQFLQPALGGLAVAMPDAQLSAVVFGASTPSVLPEFGMDTIFIGTLADDISLALLYSAADVFVAPSLQENLSNTVMESLSCGTPVVAFDISGMSDLIEHRCNGYLAKPFDTEDLANGLRWVLEDENRTQFLSRRAREKVIAEFDSKVVGERHLALYKDILEPGTHP